MNEINKQKLYKMKDVIEMISFSPNLICVTDFQGTLLFTNSSWLKILGRNPENLAEKDLTSFVHINDVGRTKETLRNASSQKIEDFENRYYHKDGSIRYIKWTSKPITDEQLIIGIGTDITHEKTFFHQMNNFYSALTDTAIVSVTDIRGKIVEVNQTFCEISGYQEHELLGRDHRILNSKMHPPGFFKDLWDTILDKKTWRGEVCNMRKDGSLYWVDSFVLALTNLNGEIEKFISIRYDITDKKENEQHVLQTAKLATIGEMSASIAHEINNPLSMIKFVAEDLGQAISKDVIVKEDIEDSTNYINNAITRIVTIIKGLQAYARQSETDGMELQGLDKIVEEAMVFSQYKFKDTGVEFKLGEMVDATVYARPSQISQIIVNLFSNAIDAIAKTSKRWVELSSTIVDEKLLISVTDSGHGISEEVAKKLMTPFFTTKKSGKGTGLGLSLSLKLANQHGGDLRYDSGSQNTRFILELPLAKK